jgi:hypothetical protein
MTQPGKLCRALSGKPHDGELCGNRLIFDDDTHAHCEDGHYWSACNCGLDRGGIDICYGWRSTYNDERINDCQCFCCVPEGSRPSVYKHL